MRWPLLGLTLALGVLWAAPQAAAADLASIRERGYLIVAVREGWRPLSFRAPSEELVGLEIDIAHQLAAEIFDDPNAVVFEVVANGERLPSVLSDQADVAIAGLTVTPERMRLVSFSPPYYLDGAGLLVRDPALQSLADLRQRRIGVLQGSSTVDSIRYVLPTADLVAFDSYQAAMASLSTGQIEAFAGDLTVLVGWQQDYPGYYLLSSVVSAEPLAVALPKGTQYTELHTLIDNALTTWHQTGWLEERTTFWGLP